jgi:PEP-CTERM motif
MKRKALAVVLGVAGMLGMAASSYGQGNIIFNTYASSPYYPIVYGSVAQGVDASLAGTGAGQNVEAELGYFIGTSSSPSDFTLIPSSITPVIAATEPPNGVGSAISGYLAGPTLSITGYSSGPISFEILAWVASGTGAGGGTFATSGYNGSLIWTEPSIASGQSPAGYFTAMPGDVTMLPTSPVPEPSTWALAGLGALAFLAFRRKKAQVC